MGSVLLNGAGLVMSLNWLSVRFFTEGWDIFFQEEFTTLSIVSLLVGLVDFILGHSLSCFLTQVTLLILLRRVVAGGMCSSSKRLDGQTIVVTGCNVGIGRETVRALSHRGAKVVMACRDTHMAEKVAAEIMRETGGELVVIKLDLASLTSVRAFAADLKTKESRIHMLINNAGVMSCPYKKTEDDFEMQMGTNHLGHFLLTCLLLPLLTHIEPARIINVSSLGHAGGIIPFEDMNLEKSYNRFEAYYNSKLANILFTRQLAKRLKGTNIQVFSLHPGSVQSNLARHLFNKDWLPNGSLSKLMLKTTVEGAQTTLYCALEAKQQDPYYYRQTKKFVLFPWASWNKWFKVDLHWMLAEQQVNRMIPFLATSSSGDCTLGACIKAAQDDELAEKLWKVSEEMVGLSKSEPSSGSKSKE